MTVRTDAQILAMMRVTINGPITDARMRDLYDTLRNRLPEIQPGQIGWLRRMRADGLGCEYYPLASAIVPEPTPEDEGKWIRVGPGGVLQLVYPSDIFPPVNVSRPTISGIPHVGEVIVGQLGEWNGAGITYGLQWKAGGADIPGAQTNTLSLDPLLLGQVITFQVTGTSAGGMVVATSDGVTVTQAIQLDSLDFDELTLGAPVGVIS